MKFVELHLTKHHLFHAPHKWFMAFLCSPIHLAEMHYKKRYHMKFEHARKLFVFDLILLLSTIVLAGASVYWFLFNPSISNLIYFTITPSADKIKSGDYVTLTIRYQNNSDTKILSPKISVTLPEGFLIDKAEPENIFDKDARVFTPNELPAGHSNSITISGWSFGKPDIEEKITAEMAYKQETSGYAETKPIAIYLTHRGSVIETSADGPETILAENKKIITLSLKNNSSAALAGISLQLPTADNIKWESTSTTNGIVENNVWTAGKLEPFSTSTLIAELSTVLPADSDSLELNFTPTIKINQTSFEQTPAKYSAKVVHPQLGLANNWHLEKTYLQPGDIAELKITVTNTGDVDLNDAVIQLPILTDIINVEKIRKLNQGPYLDKILFIDKSSIPALAEISVGKSVEAIIKLPILSSPQGANNQTITLEPKILANVKNIGDEYSINSKTDAIKIGTALNVNAEIRYYTIEGDQLGRGPLPPVVGKETKYWALIKISNTTSQVKDIKFSAILPNYITWTGKSSVSEGQNLIFDNEKRAMSWTIGALEPQSSAGVYFELGLTPTLAQAGTTPILIQEIILTGHDEYIDAEILKTLAPLDSSMPNDKLAKTRGVKVR